MSSRVMDRLGVFIFPWGRTPPTVESVAELAEYAEELGFDSVHMPWHHTMPKVEGQNRFIIDPLVMLPILAERTERIRLGLSSAILSAHHPFVWAQYLSSLDVASRGRVIAGAAIGWWEEDLRVGGAKKSERGARADEALEVITRLWNGEEIDEVGRFWDATGLAIDPRPLQQPLPLWIGGGPVAIERTARWGTGLMPLDMTPEYLRTEMKPKLDAAAESHGRQVDLTMMNYLVISDDDDEIERELRPRLTKIMSGMAGREEAGPDDTMIFGHPERCAEQLQAFFDAGLDYLVLNAHFHGQESESFAREQWARFVEEVVPLVDLGSD